MTETDGWLDRFEDTHRDLDSPLIFWAALFAVVVGIIGMLWALPVPDEFFDISPLFNWGTAFLMATAVYYFIISVSLAIGMLPFVLGLAALNTWLAASGLPQFAVSAGLLVAGIIGLWLGRRDRNILPVLQDLQLMMIGPAWLLSVMYKRLGIPF